MDDSQTNKDLWTMVNNVARSAEPVIGVLGMSHKDMDRKPVTIFIVPSGEASQAVKDLLDELYPSGPRYNELDVERN